MADAESKTGGRAGARADRGGPRLARAKEELKELGRREAPLERLDAARRLRESADALEQECVQAAREAGCTWAEVGRVYGLTKQAAQQRFRPRPPAAPGA